MSIVIEQEYPSMENKMTANGGNSYGRHVCLVLEVIKLTEFKALELYLRRTKFQTDNMELIFWSYNLS